MDSSELGREKQDPCREPDVGLDPGTLGSRPGPKASAQPLSPLGVPEGPCYDCSRKTKQGDLSGAEVRAQLCSPLCRRGRGREGKDGKALAPEPTGIMRGNSRRFGLRLVQPQSMGRESSEASTLRGSSGAREPPGSHSGAPVS